MNLFVKNGRVRKFWLTDPEYSGPKNLRNLCIDIIERLSMTFTANGKRQK